ncbi:MAG: long-chain-fatty-acid--CoA ligase [SAR324 cluster bacterium]|nr:long-chain-fatty-acid--CoA ligase [SAR324 cluster bacterium]
MYESGPMSTNSNYTPLTPQSFLRRSARVYPDKAAMIYGAARTSYKELYERACRQANALRALGIGKDKKVALLAPNTPPHLEAHFGVHMAGGVLVSINTRLSPKEIAFIAGHSQAEVMIVDWEWLPVIESVHGDLQGIRQFVVIHEPAAGTGWEPAGAVDYEAWLAASSAEDPHIYPDDENDTITINYTSGTTGNPKGVVYTHRGAYLNGVCNLLEMNMNADSVYMWTLPMFHCNGWCYTWGVTAIGGTHVCMRGTDPREVIKTIIERQVTHFCGAPIVLKMIADGAEAAGVKAFPHRVKVSTAAAPPSPSVISAMMALNVDVIHVYGLTETYGPTTVCEIQPDWREEETGGLARLMARQGVPYILCEDVQVMDESDNRVPADGKTMGEVCMRGNIVMKGYYRNPEASAESFRNGWFHSGDLGVMHADGYIEIKDRAKDIIISGGENISTIEVENMLYTHPAVQDVAVVSKPDEKWGEVPIAFITPKEGVEVSEEEIIQFSRDNLAHFKAPKGVFFETLPRTSTGKVQKYVLRERFWSGRDKPIGG